MKKAIIIIILLLLPIILASQDLKYWFAEEFEGNIIPEKRIALVIGNTDYNDDLLDLKNPVNDASLISSTLTKLDFDVILRENLNKKETLDAIKDFKNKHTEYDFSVIYYAGHALQDQNGNSFLVPTDYSLEDSITDSSINLSGLLNYFELSNTPTLLIFDACRETDNTGLNKPAIQDPQNVKLAYSTSFGKTASDNSNLDNTIYTSYLSKLFLMKGLSIQDILKNTSKFVLRHSEGKQYPVNYFGIFVEDIQLIKIIE